MLCRVVTLSCLGFFILMAFPSGSSAGPVTDAALSGNVAEIERLLDEGGEVDEAGLAGPLYFAIQRGHTEAAMLLIDRGADVNRMSKWGTPLHIASRKGNAVVVKALLDLGADLTLQGGDDKWTPLHDAAIGGSVETTALLIEHGADVNAPTRFLEPPIHFAVLKDHEDVARLLREHGASPPLVEPISSEIAGADLEQGRLRAIVCNECHALEAGKVSEGPNLWNIVGRPKASLDGYPYSDALTAVGGIWDFEELNRFVAHTTRTVPGTSMDYGFETERHVRINLIAYLRTLSDAPVPLP